MYITRLAIPNTQKELVENGNGKAVFDFSLVTAFKVIENVSEKYFEEGFGEDITKSIQRKSSNTPPKKPDKSQINEQEKPDNAQTDILNIIHSNPEISIPKIAEIIKRTPDSVRYHLRQLTKKGIVEREGSR